MSKKLLLSILLLKQKVKQMVIMEGIFPEVEREWDFCGDMPVVARLVLVNYLFRWCSPVMR